MGLYIIYSSPRLEWFESYREQLSVFTIRPNAKTIILHSTFRNLIAWKFTQVRFHNYFCLNGYIEETVWCTYSTHKTCSIPDPEFTESRIAGICV